jgi:hypothetical protein
MDHTRSVFDKSATKIVGQSINNIRGAANKHVSRWFRYIYD